MTKRIGHVIELIFNGNGGAYLGENGVITCNINNAKTFRAAPKVLSTIQGQAITNFPKGEVQTRLIERWAEK